MTRDKITSDRTYMYHIRSAGRRSFTLYSLIADSCIRVDWLPRPTFSFRPQIELIHTICNSARDTCIHSQELFINIKCREVDIFYGRIRQIEGMFFGQSPNLLREAKSHLERLRFLCSMLYRNVTVLRTSQYVNGFDATQLLIFLLRIGFDCVYGRHGTSTFSCLLEILTNSTVWCTLLRLISTLLFVIWRF